MEISKSRMDWKNKLFLDIGFEVIYKNIRKQLV